MQFKVLTGFAAAMLATAALAHGDHDPDSGKGKKPPPLAILQLDQVRDADGEVSPTSAAAEAAGYVDIGLFVPNMGWHYMNEELWTMASSTATRPELLVYADDPCGGKRKLVAVEYAIPLSMSKRAPAGFVGRADEWDANQTFQLWTLHAWVLRVQPGRRVRAVQSPSPVMWGAGSGNRENFPRFPARLLPASESYPGFPTRHHSGGGGCAYVASASDCSSNSRPSSSCASGIVSGARMRMTFE